MNRQEKLHLICSYVDHTSLTRSLSVEYEKVTVVIKRGFDKLMYCTPTRGVHVSWFLEASHDRFLDACVEVVRTKKIK